MHANHSRPGSARSRGAVLGAVLALLATCGSDDDGRNAGGAACSDVVGCGAGLVCCGTCGSQSCSGTCAPPCTGAGCTDGCASGQRIGP